MFLCGVLGDDSGFQHCTTWAMGAQGPEMQRVPQVAGAPSNHVWRRARKVR